MSMLFPVVLAPLLDFKLQLSFDDSTRSIEARPNHTINAWAGKSMRGWAEACRDPAVTCVEIFGSSTSAAWQTTAYIVTTTLLTAVR